MVDEDTLNFDQNLEDDLEGIEPICHDSKVPADKHSSYEAEELETENGLLESELMNAVLRRIRSIEKGQLISLVFVEGKTSSGHNVMGELCE